MAQHLNCEEVLLSPRLGPGSPPFVRLSPPIGCPTAQGTHTKVPHTGSQVVRQVLRVKHVPTDVEQQLDQSGGFLSGSKLKSAVQRPEHRSVSDSRPEHAQSACGQRAVAGAPRGPGFAPRPGGSPPPSPAPSPRALPLPGPPRPSPGGAARAPRHPLGRSAAAPPLPAAASSSTSGARRTGGGRTAAAPTPGPETGSSKSHPGRKRGAGGGGGDAGGEAGERAPVTRAARRTARACENNGQSVTRAPKPSLPASPYIDKNPQSGRRRAGVTEARGRQRGTCGGAGGRGLRARARRGGASRGVPRGERSAPRAPPAAGCPHLELGRRGAPGAVPPTPFLDLRVSLAGSHLALLLSISARARQHSGVTQAGEAGCWAAVGMGVRVCREPLLLADGRTPRGWQEGRNTGVGGGGPGSSWSRKIPYTSGQRSLCTPAVEPMCCNY
ncbi:translation initiation factor IF-2-like [Cervus elaphus]|uniref:translation initiation factor IF-2-like n=1 Tax=Cervus elaphus TaxID=9860 RepID=UPI001CC33095|nr:translation initiation factor IF-2-like [Cervus elaphus]